MVSITLQEQIEALKEMVRKHEPYPKDVFEKMVSVVDGKSRENDNRYGARLCLDALLGMGFSEDEVNPWKEKH